MGVLKTLWRTLLRQGASESSSVLDAALVPEVVPTAEVVPSRPLEALVDPEMLVFSVQPDNLLESHLTAGVAEEYFDSYAAKIAGTIAKVYGEGIHSEKSVQQRSLHPCYHYSFSLEGVEVEFAAHMAGFSPTWDKPPSYNLVIYQLSLKITEASLDKERAGAFLRELLKYSNLNCRWDEDENRYLFLIFHNKGETQVSKGVELLKKLNVSLELTYEHGVVPRTVTPDYQIGTAIRHVRSSGELPVN